MKNVFFAALFFLVSTSSFAVVDMDNGNYTESWIDVDPNSGGLELRITRTYNGRASFDGMFGYGWCSDLETRIDAMPDGSLKLTECGAGQEVIYRPAAAEGVAMHQEGKRYQTNGRNSDSIIYSSVQYIRSLSGGNKEIFDACGRRVKTEDANGNYLQYTYEGGRLKKVSSNNGREVVFNFGSSGKVESILSSGKKSASYRYAGGNLVSVTNAWGNIYGYEYDAGHRLTRATWPDQSFVKLKYDAAHDWVTGFTDRDGCEESYDYQEDAQNHYWSNVTKACNGEKVGVAKHEFWREIHADGKGYLARIRSEVDGKVRDVRYHETFGLPVFIASEGGEYRYTYYPNGLLKSKDGRYKTTSFVYQERNPIEVVSITKNEKGKKLKLARSVFSYDAKGNIIKVSNSEGAKLEVGYDANGQIILLRDNKRNELKISNDPKCDKPSIIQARGLGTVRIAYNESCEIEKADSASGPSVAMQVSTRMGDMVGVLAPAKMEGLYE